MPRSKIKKCLNKLVILIGLTSVVTASPTFAETRLVRINYKTHSSKTVFIGMDKLGSFRASECSGYSVTKANWGSTQLVDKVQDRTRNYIQGDPHGSEMFLTFEKLGDNKVLVKTKGQETTLINNEFLTSSISLDDVAVFLEGSWTDFEAGRSVRLTSDGSMDDYNNNYMANWFLVEMQRAIGIPGEYNARWGKFQLEKFGSTGRALYLGNSKEMAILSSDSEIQVSSSLSMDF